ncbi:MAG: PKD domain-containing protein, partial [Acidimicrobiaceae bacterium]
IGAFSGAAKATEVEVKVGGAAAEKVTVRTEPSSIPQTGGTVTVIAGVTDASGNALPNTPINFTVDQGSLSSSSSTTDANGDARVTLTTNRTTKVTANVAGKTAEFTVTALAAPAVAISGCTAAQAVGVSVNCTITPTVATGGSPILSLTVNWGDSSGEQPIGGVAATSASHTYAASGNYTMVAAATDLNSQRGTAAIAFVVSRINPTISITASATTGSVGVPISFTVTPAANPPQPITNVTVDFGDGNTRNLGVISSAATVSRTYGSEGTFTVTATVTDQSGGRGNATTQVVIGRASAPTITFSQTSGTTPAATPATPETFSVSATAATGLSIRTIVVKNAGGTILYNGTGGGTFAAAVTAGDILTATVTDSAGNTSTSQLVVQ